MSATVKTLSFYILILPALCWAQPCDIPAIIVFGDSNSDTGGLSATFGPVPPPYGETFFRMPAGRYSDGRLIIDFIAEKLGLPYISSYLDSLGTNFSHGANFATATATILRQNLSLSVGGYSPFSLEEQLLQFSQFQSRSQQVLKRGGIFKSLMPQESYFKKALYIFDIGQNDISQGYDANKTVNEFVPDALSILSTVVKGVYEIGGRSFWIHNTGPSGCLSFYLLKRPLATEQKDSVGCSIPFIDYAKQFNRLLNDTVARLRRELPLAAITYVDIYSAKYYLFSHAQELGFEHPLTVCCGYGGGDYNFDYNVRCGNTATLNGTKILLGRSCKEPKKRIIWDGIHYTETANKWVSDQISAGKFLDPPLSLTEACRRRST